MKRIESRDAVVNMLCFIWIFSLLEWSALVCSWRGGYHFLPQVSVLCSSARFQEAEIIGVTVRRERRGTSAGATSARELVLHPVASETVAETTRRSELSMERVAGRLRERAGHTVSK